MKSFRSRRAPTLSTEARELRRLASGLAESGSRTEDAFWEMRLDETLGQLLEQGDEELLNATLDALYEDQRAYDVLAESLESRVERSLDGEVLLIALPVLAWSRFTIPACQLSSSVLQDLRVQLQAHVLAREVPLALADRLLSPEQLPQGFCETSRFCNAMAEPLRASAALHIEDEGLPEAARFLSDVRYVLAAIGVRAGQPLFRWQESDGSRAEALRHWQQQGGAALAPVLTACAFELGLPDAFFAASRQADRDSRAFSIGASVDFLTSTLDAPAESLHAVVAMFRDQEVEEFRIGFTRRESNAVIHGVVWPLLGPDDDAAENLVAIETALRARGVEQIGMLEQRFPLEYCDDCGAPLYPSPEGEALHAELPEENAEQVPRHLH